MKDYLDDEDLTPSLTLPSELQEPFEPSPRVTLTSPAKIAAMAVPVILFATVVWSVFG